MQKGPPVLLSLLKQLCYVTTLTGATRWSSCFTSALPSWFAGWFLLLVLMACPGLLAAQKAPLLALYTDVHNRYQLTYPLTWQLVESAAGTEATFSAGGATRPAPAVVAFTMRPLPDDQKELSLIAQGGQDSLWRSIQRLPQAQVLRLSQRDYGSYEEARYDYTYAPTPPSRTHVVGLLIWRAGYAFRLEYRAEFSQDGRYLLEAQRLMDSFAFTKNPIPSRRYADQVCNNKMYGISAMRYRNGQWEDDCRTIHEFPFANLKAPPVVHTQALPFQSYALAKGFDNSLYSVTKAPTDTPELVYRYDPATRQGRYTTWQLPAQGPEVSWISGATDERGYLYFLTSDANLLVRVSPFDGTVRTLWTTDPLSRTPFYPYIGFAGAGTHGNFCLDDTNTMYLVYSTNGSLLKINLNNRQPYPEMLPLAGLPKNGGYSDLLMQNDEDGSRHLYLAGPRGVYKVDLARKRASLVRKGTYTDLAGCNLFPNAPPPPTPAPPLPATATWRGRVLNAATSQPLPQAELRLGLNEAGTAVPITPQGTFSYSGAPGRTYSYHARLMGYFATDTTWTAAPGAYVRDILLHPLTVGTTLQLDNVQFEQSAAVLLPSSFPALNKLVDLLADNPRLTIELRGHTDNVGPPEKNIVLSQQRVAAVKGYLVGHGIAEGRVSGIGFGGAQPTANNEQETTRKLNRRVEFRVTGLQ